MATNKFIPIPLGVPAFAGLNKEGEGSILSQEWAVELDNFVFSKTGKLAARKGWKKVNSSAISGTPNVKAILEHGTTVSRDLISAAGNKLYLGTSSLTDITGTITTPTGDYWKLLNFNNKCVGFQEGHAPIVLDGSTFSDLVPDYGTSAMPTTWGGAAVSAFGRIWTIDDTKTVIKYCGLLDETNWDAVVVSPSDADAGYIDLKTVWKGGIDQVVAIESFNGQLVILCKNSILIYGNPWQPVTGMALVENIWGIGCSARDSVQAIGKDLWFLSYSGIRSLGRTVANDKMPIGDISKNVRSSLVTYSTVGNSDEIKSVYSEEEGFYILSIPSASTCFVFDVRAPLGDGAYRCTTWSSINPTALERGQDGTIYMGQAGYIGRYSGYLDNTSTYLVTFTSGWFSKEMIANRYMIFKNMKIYLESGADTTLTAKWAFDFEGSVRSRSVSVDVQSTGDEYGVGEYALAEYSGGGGWDVLSIPTSGYGTVLKYGFTSTINDNTLSFQKVDLFMKMGRVN